MDTARTLIICWRGGIVRHRLWWEIDSFSATTDFPNRHFQTFHLSREWSAGVKRRKNFALKLTCLSTIIQQSSRELCCATSSAVNTFAWLLPSLCMHPFESHSRCFFTSTSLHRSSGTFYFLQRPWQPLVAMLFPAPNNCLKHLWGPRHCCSAILTSSLGHMHRHAYGCIG